MLAPPVLGGLLLLAAAAHFFAFIVLFFGLMLPLIGLMSFSSSIFLPSILFYQRSRTLLATFFYIPAASEFAFMNSSICMKPPPTLTRTEFPFPSLRNTLFLPNLYTPSLSLKNIYFRFFRSGWPLRYYERALSTSSVLWAIYIAWSFSRLLLTSATLVNFFSVVSSAFSRFLSCSRSSSCTLLASYAFSSSYTCCSFCFIMVSFNYLRLFSDLTSSWSNCSLASSDLSTFSFRISSRSRSFYFLILSMFAEFSILTWTFILISYSSLPYNYSTSSWWSFLHLSMCSAHSFLYFSIILRLSLWSDFNLSPSCFCSSLIYSISMLYLALIWSIYFRNFSPCYLFSPLSLSIISSESSLTSSFCCIIYNVVFNR